MRSERILLTSATAVGGHQDLAYVLKDKSHWGMPLMDSLIIQGLYLYRYAAVGFCDVFALFPVKLESLPGVKLLKGCNASSWHILQLRSLKHFGV